MSGGVVGGHRGFGAGAQRAIALGLMAALATPWLREALEATMTRHMLMQFPLVMLAGALLAAPADGRLRARIARWNAHGIAGLVFCAVALAVLMIPRMLDLAVRDVWVECAKGGALVACGAALRLSWRTAGAIVQGFFLGNVVPMSIAIGQLYVDSPLRLCNAYQLDDQKRLGAWLTGSAATLGVLWLLGIGWRMIRSDGDAPAQR